MTLRELLEHYDVQPDDVLNTHVNEQYVNAVIGAPKATASIRPHGSRRATLLIEVRVEGTVS